MAIGAAAVWEIRATNGLDTNGGGFIAGAAGTDYSQQNAKNTVGADISTTDAITAATTTLTSATANFGTTIVGNIIYLQGGTGALAAGWYQVTARASATSVTIDRAPGVSTGVTMNIGGALQSLTTCFSVFVAKNKAYMKGEANYVQTATATSAVTGTPGSASPKHLVQGYGTTRGDSGMATIQLSTNAGLAGISTSANNWDFVNLVVDCNNLATSTGFTTSAGTTVCWTNCKAMNFTTAGFNIIASFLLINCEATGGSAAATGAMVDSTTGNVFFYGCYIHDNACPGIVATANGSVVIAGCIFSNNSGASSDGYITTSTNIDVIVNSTFYACGRHGINYNVNNNNSKIIKDNLFSNNGGYGIQLNTTAGSKAMPLYDGNAFYLNTSGSRNNMNDISVNVVNSVAPFTPVMDVNCTASPFVNAASADFRLNQTGGGGGMIRGYGQPQNWLGLSLGVRSFQDMGAVQHQDPGHAE